MVHSALATYVHVQMDKCCSVYIVMVCMRGCKRCFATDKSNLYLQSNLHLHVHIYVMGIYMYMYIHACSMHCLCHIREVHVHICFWNKSRVPRARSTQGPNHFFQKHTEHRRYITIYVHVYVRTLQPLTPQIYAYSSLCPECLNSVCVLQHYMRTLYTATHYNLNKEITGSLVF